MWRRPRVDRGWRRKRRVPSAPAGALIGRIGADGRPFHIGAQPAIQIPEAGTLYLSINDGERSDNSGEFIVLIDPQVSRR